MAFGMFAFVTLGVGMFIGSWLSGLVVDAYRTAGPLPHDWMRIWLAPAAMAAGVLLLFALLFKAPAPYEKAAEPTR